jgi:hypothetical protein
MAYDPAAVRSLYRKLLSLYPRAFRERLGESMEQTFNDLCNERKGQTGRGWLGFIVRVFAETALGIGQEYLLSIKQMNPMKNILTSLRSPAIISFLILVPFMLLDFTFNIVKRLNTFSLRNALDLIVIFGFLWLGLAAILLILMPIVRTLRAGNTLMAAPELTQGNAMTDILNNPRSAVILSVVLALPFIAILSLLALGVEPSFGPLEPLLNNPDPDQPDVLGSLIVLGAFLLLVLACIIVRAPIVRTMRAGGSLLAHPINLMLAVVILSLITMVVVGLMGDQFPCWIGVPNCD